MRKVRIIFVIASDYLITQEMKIKIFHLLRRHRIRPNILINIVIL